MRPGQPALPISGASKGAALAAALATAVSVIAPAEARKAKPPAAEPTPPAAEPTPAPSRGPDGQPLAPVQPPPAVPLVPAAPVSPMFAEPPGFPTVVATRERPFWELSAIGGGLIGGAWVLGSIVGALSYAGYYQGQWGWFVPVAGPFLSMTNVDGGDPNGCLSKAAYTYSFGPILTIITVGGIATAIAGGIAKKRVPVTAPATPTAVPVQVAPSVGPGTGGLTFSGRF